MHIFRQAQMMDDALTSSSSKVLKVYFETSWLHSFDELDTIPIVKNLIGRRTGMTNHEISLDTSIKENYYKYIDLPIQETSLDACDVILIPVFHTDAHQPDDVKIQHFSRICKQADQLSKLSRKPVLVHSNTKDIIDTRKQAYLPLDNFFYLSPNIRHSIAPDNYLSKPYFIPDYVEYFYAGAVQPHEWTPQPKVGFVGVAAPFGQHRPTKTWFVDWIRFFATWLNRIGIDTDRLCDQVGTNMKHAYRTRVLWELMRSPMIDRDILFRCTSGTVDKQYWRAAMTSPYHLEYFSNLINNVYIPCCRGTENYSIRFYEALAFGRVPVLVNSDLRLPLSNLIDYEKHCCLIDKKDIHRVSDILVQFHESKKSCLRELQVINRSIWKEYLSIESFYKFIPAQIATGSIAIERTN